MNFDLLDMKFHYLLGIEIIAQEFTQEKNSFWSWVISFSFFLKSKWNIHYIDKKKTEKKRPKVLANTPHALNSGVFSHIATGV